MSNPAVQSDGPPAFEVVPGDPTSTVILHVPHASTWIPANVRDGILLSDRELLTELKAITDADTDILALGAADLCTVRPWVFVNRASRLVIDPERFPDEREEMSAVGMGAVYVSTTNRSVLRRPSQQERDGLLASFYTPYSDAIAALVRDRLEANGRVTIIDLHSYPMDKLPYELHGDGQRPEVCVGTDPVHTPNELELSTISKMRTAAPTGEVALNSPFAGCYVPLDQYGTNRDVHAVMLEIRRDVVSTRMSHLQTATAELVDLIDQLRG